MRKFIIIAVLGLFYQIGFSQNNSIHTTRILKGRIVDVVTKFPLESANIINLNSIEGTTTRRNGTFQIAAQANDTLYISYIGYQSIKLKITNDLLKGNEIEIGMHTKVISLNEVTLKSHQLIGVLVVDANNIPKDKFTRIHINGLPQTYEVGVSVAQNYSSAVSAIFNPVDFWYTKFSKRGKELRKLKEIREKGSLRRIMEGKFNREIMMDFMNMSRKELNDLLNDCNYSEYFIKRASDLQIIEAVLDCYNNYKALKEGYITKPNKISKSKKN